MSYPRENTITLSNVGSANAGVGVILGGVATGAIANGQTGSPMHNIGASSRWRIRHIHAGFTAAAVSFAAALILTDGVQTVSWAVGGNGITLTNLDLQCAAGAEVDITLAAGGASTIGRVTVIAVME